MLKCPTFPGVWGTPSMFGQFPGAKRFSALSKRKAEHAATKHFNGDQKPPSPADWDTPPISIAATPPTELGRDSNSERHN